MEDVGDVDTLNDREDEWRQDRSSLHHSSLWERGRGADLDMDVTGGQDRERETNRKILYGEG